MRLILMETKLDYVLLGYSFLNENMILIYFGKEIPRDYLEVVIEHEEGHLILRNLSKELGDRLRRELDRIIEGPRDFKLEMIVEKNFIQKNLGKSEILPNYFVRNKEILRDLALGRIWYFTYLKPELFPFGYNLVLGARMLIIGSFLKNLSYLEIPYILDKVKKELNKEPSDLAIRIMEDSYKFALKVSKEGKSYLNNSILSVSSSNS